jgi:hypothetical protein
MATGIGYDAFASMNPGKIHKETLRKIRPHLQKSFPPRGKKKVHPNPPYPMCPNRPPVWCPSQMQIKMVAIRPDAYHKPHISTLPCIKQTVLFSYITIRKTVSL